MGIVIFFAGVVVVVLLGAFFYDVRRRKTRDLQDWQTSQHPAKAREGSEFRQGPPGGYGSGGG